MRKYKVGNASIRGSGLLPGVLLLLHYGCDLYKGKGFLSPDFLVVDLPP